MNWLVRYWDEGSGKSPVEKWLNALTEEQFEAVYEEIQMLKVLGNILKMPHSKALGEKLFELRERKYGYRIYYTFKKQQVIVLLAAGNKSSQVKDIKKARERMLS